MSSTSRPLTRYHVFLLTPGDVDDERHQVRRFFDDFNRRTAHNWGVEFDVIGWENFATLGLGRPTRQLTAPGTLDRYRDSLALVIGIIGQRFGSPTRATESGTEEEFQWAMQSQAEHGFPAIKWFFRRTANLVISEDPDEALQALEQWKKVRTFRRRIEEDNPGLYREFAGTAEFAQALANDLTRWLSDVERPWTPREGGLEGATREAKSEQELDEIQFDRYRTALLRRFDKLNVDILESTGAFHGGISLWDLFVPQSVRESVALNTQPLELPKDLQRVLLEATPIVPAEPEWGHKLTDDFRREYLSHPLVPVLNVIDGAFGGHWHRRSQRLVILGDPGSGKSSLLRYVALRWARQAESTVSGTQAIPIVIDLSQYATWKIHGSSGFVQFLEEGEVWHEWNRGMLNRLFHQPNRLALLLDGLDEIFDHGMRVSVVDDILRFSGAYDETPVIVTSRVVGYKTAYLKDAGFRHFVLQELSGAQIDTFVDRWHEQTLGNSEETRARAKRLKRAVADSRSIQSLAGNPLLLTMMAILNSTQELPRDRAELYGQAARIVLHQWDTARAFETFPGLSEEIGFREKSDILRRVAACMQRSTYGLALNAIDDVTLIALIEEYLRSELHFNQSRAAARTVVEHLRERNFVLCDLGGNLYGFVHRTFLEYFCAQDFVHRFNVEETLDQDALMAVFEEHCRDDDWREVLRLISGQIDELFVLAIVWHLIARIDVETWNPHAPLPELLLAIGCLSEGRRTARAEAVGRQLLNKTIDVMCEASDTGFQRALTFACEELADRWPGGESITSFVLTRPSRFAPGTDTTQRFWPRFCALLGASREQIERLCDITDGSSSGAFFQIGAIETLAEFWKDDQRRTWLVNRATTDPRAHQREAALQALAANWPDSATRDLHTVRAALDPHESPRGSALRALSATWPDKVTRSLLVERTHTDQSPYVRRICLESLAANWPDPKTYSLLVARAVGDAAAEARIAALDLLADKWPNGDTRALLTVCAVKDSLSGPRSSALRALTHNWRDATTQGLLAARAVDDPDGALRSVAMASLATTWPDETTRRLLTRRAVEDSDTQARQGALKSLAAQWPDETTREFLSARAVDDPDGESRGAALDSLVTGWPVHTTRALVATRAFDDSYDGVRHRALALLAARWPDDSTRALLASRAQVDADGRVRCAAVESLASKWPDNKTRELLTMRAVHDHDMATRTAALTWLATRWPDISTCEIVTHAATGDPDEQVRLVACETLSKHWWQDPAIRSLLRTRLTAEEDAVVLRNVTRTIENASRRLLAVWKNRLSGQALDEEKAQTLPGYPTFRISAFRIRDIGPFQDTGWLHLQRGVNVFLGDNAAGKTTLLRCLALAALGLPAANEVENNASSYLRKGTDQGLIEVRFELVPDPDSLDTEVDVFATSLQIAGSSRFAAGPGTVVVIGEDGNAEELLNSIEHLGALRSTSPSSFGLVCAYGAGRTFSETRNTALARQKERENTWVRSLFEPNAWLVTPELLGQLLRGDLSGLDDETPGRHLPEVLLNSLRATLERMLPGKERTWSDRGDCDLQLYGTDLQFNELSEGYRSLLAMLGHLVTCSLKSREWNADANRIDGMALIDEIDVHLHPAWQHHVVHDLHAAFPNVQLIASTHSPLVIGALKRDNIFIMRRDESGSIAIARPELDPQGMGVAGILTSMFDLSSTIDQPTLDKMTRRLLLHGKRETWTAAEEREYAKLAEELGQLGFNRELSDPYYEQFAVAMAKEHAVRVGTLTPQEKQELDEYAARLVSTLVKPDGSDDSR